MFRILISYFRTTSALARQAIALRPPYASRQGYGCPQANFLLISTAVLVILSHFLVVPQATLMIGAVVFLLVIALRVPPAQFLSLLILSTGTVCFFCWQQNSNGAKLLTMSGQVITASLTEAVKISGSDRLKLSLSTEDESLRFTCLLSGLDNYPPALILGLREHSLIRLKPTISRLDLTNSFDRYLYFSREPVKCKTTFISLQSQGSSQIAEVNAKISRQVFGLAGSSEAKALILAVIFGQKHYLSAAQKQQFKTYGLTHLLVVSGYQISLFFVFLLFVGRRAASLLPLVLLRQINRCVGLRKLLFFAVTLSLVWLYTALTSYDQACLRAAISISVYCSYQLLDQSSKCSLGQLVWTTLFIIVALEPFAITTVSLQLTLAALIAIAIGSQQLDPAAGRVSRLKSLITYLPQMWLIGVFTGVIILIRFDEIQPAGFYYNVVYAPILTIFCGLPSALLIALSACGLGTANFLLSLNMYLLDLILLLMEGNYRLLPEISINCYRAVMVSSACLLLFGALLRAGLRSKLCRLSD